ncbi:MAG: BLUF domain-containing protein [Rhodobacteraceae bacterium]|nr:MAG: BLUF domain-containing protein [Paracoccaceae bacterium]
MSVRAGKRRLSVISDIRCKALVKQSCRFCLGKHPLLYPIFTDLDLRLETGSVLGAKLRRLIYLSSAEQGFTAADLDDVLTVSRRNNHRDGVTGLLAYHDGCFFQAVEGPADAIAALLSRIRTDKRHCNILTLSDTTPTERAFPDWNMALVPRTELAQVASKAGISLTELSENPFQLSADRRVNILFASFLQGFRDVTPRVSFR